VACNFSDGNVVNVDERAIQTEDQLNCCFLIRYYLLLAGGAGGNIPQRFVEIPLNGGSTDATVIRPSGVPVVAHPMSESRGPALPLEYLGQMADAGLAGVEVYHRENSESNRARLLEFARDRELLVTGSSDYHGAGKPNRLGENTTARETVEAIRAQIRG